MIARWLGPPDKRSKWIFALAILCITVCVTVAVKGPRSGRFGLLIGASLTGWLGSHMLMRSWHGLSKTIPEIYEEPLRTGGRMSFAAKLLSLLCIGLGIMGFMAKYAA